MEVNDKNLKWRVFKDTKPDDCQICIIYINSDIIDEVSCCVYDKEGYFINDEYMIFHDVTHWMPMPDPPCKN
jgi:hypothetical protein